MLRPKHNSNWIYIGNCGHLLLFPWPKGEGKSFVSLNLKHNTGSVNNQQQRGIYHPVTQKLLWLLPQVNFEDKWLVFQHDAISSRKSSWRKWQATPNSFKRPQSLKKTLAYYVMEFFEEKGRTERCPSLQGKSRTPSEPKQNTSWMCNEWDACFDD